MVPVMAPDATPRSCIDFAVRAEAVGAHSVWMPDRIMFESPDALVSLGAIAAVTSRVKIGTKVIVI